MWSAGDFNTVSLGLARELGFREVSRSAYVVPDPKDAGTLCGWPWDVEHGTKPDDA